MTATDKQMRQSGVKNPSVKHHSIRIPLTDITINYAFDISTVLLLDGLFYLLNVGLPYMFTEAEYPLYMYFGLKESVSKNNNVRPFMKLGLQWLGSTNAFWAMQLLVTGYHLNKNRDLTPQQSALFVLPFTLMHLVTSAVIFTYGLTGADFAIGGQHITWLLSFGSHGVAGFTLLYMFFKYYTVHSITATARNVFSVYSNAFVYNKQTVAMQLSTLYFASWATLVTVFPLFLRTMFDHPYWSNKLSVWQELHLFVTGVKQTATGGSLSQDQYNALCMMFLVACAMLAFVGVAVNISIQYLLKITKFDKNLMYQLHSVMAIGHVLQLIMFADWFFRPNIILDNIATSTHAVLERWLPIILSNVLLTVLHLIARKPGSITKKMH